MYNRRIATARKGGFIGVRKRRRSQGERVGFMSHDSGEPVAVTVSHTGYACKIICRSNLLG